jgi:DNA mismatch endonuclease, patch repair protein
MVSSHDAPPVTAQRSALMRKIRGKNSTPERIVRSALHKAGYRFRLHDDRLPGRPDIVLASRRLAIFVHGCFWHRHPGCRAASIPKTRTAFWQEKFARNVERDRRDVAALEAAGWHVYVVWECETNGRGVPFDQRLFSLMESLPTSADRWGTSRNRDRTEIGDKHFIQVTVIPSLVTPDPT